MTTTLGIDVSYWQTNAGSTKPLDFVKAMNAGANFVFIRCSYGDILDTKFIKNWENARNVNLIRGAYHFVLPLKNYKSQITLLINTLKSDSGELPIALDLEDYQGSLYGSSRTNTLYVLQNFKTDIENQLGKDIILYTSPSVISSYLHPVPQWLLDCDLWIANYKVNKPYVTEWKDWKFWQYSSTGIGKNYGVESATIDLDYFNGTKEELIAYSKGLPPPPPPKTVEERLTNMENWATNKFGYIKLT